MVWYNAFLIGVAGALVMYIIIFRHSRFTDFRKDPKKNFPIVLWDVFMYLIAGGLVTVFLIAPQTIKEAFLGGATWEGALGGLLLNIEHGKRKKYLETIDSSQRS